MPRQADPDRTDHLAGKKTLVLHHYRVMEQMLSMLYGLSGIAASALYVPQILEYHRNRAARRSISLVSWAGWIVIALVSILYALYVAKNVLFAVVAGLNVAAQIVVLTYGINARLAKRSAVQRLPK